VCSRPLDGVGLFLEQGVGDSVQRCKKLLALCQAIATNRLTSWEGANRHFQIFLGAQQVLIVHLSYEAKQLSRLSLNNFIHVVKLWEKAIAQHLDLPYQVGKGISVDITHLESLTTEPQEELKERSVHRACYAPSHGAAVNSEWRKSA